MAVDMLLTQIERAKGIKKAIGIEMLIETPLGMQNIYEIAGGLEAQRKACCLVLLIMRLIAGRRLP